MTHRLAIYLLVDWFDILKQRLAGVLGWPWSPGFKCSSTSQVAELSLRGCSACPVSGPALCALPAQHIPVAKIIPVWALVRSLQGFCLLGLPDPGEADCSPLGWRGSPQSESDICLYRTPQTWGKGSAMLPHSWSSKCAWRKTNSPNFNSLPQDKEAYEISKKHPYIHAYTHK